MKRLKWTVGLLAIALLTSCGSKPTVSQNQPQADGSKPQAPLIKATAPVPNSLLPVLVPPGQITQTVPVKGLISPTNAQVQTTTISTAPQRDPFSAILSLPENFKAVITKLPQPTLVSPAKANAKGATAQTHRPHRPAALPNRVTVSQPPLNLPPSPPLANLPNLPGALPAALPVSPVSLAEAIEVTGVVQTTGKLVAIIKSPDDSSRYVQVGDYLAGGQVWLKQIVIGKSGEPRVILQQNGVEVIKSIGETGPVARSL